MQRTQLHNEANHTEQLIFSTDSDSFFMAPTLLTVVCVAYILSPIAGIRRRRCAVLTSR